MFKKSHLQSRKDFETKQYMRYETFDIGELVKSVGISPDFCRIHQRIPHCNNNDMLKKKSHDEITASS